MRNNHWAQKGQAMIEFALAVLFVMVMIFSVVEFSMYMYTYTVLADAAQEGVRYAIVHGCGTTPSTCSGTCTPACSDAGGSNVRREVKNWAQLSFHDIWAMGCTPSYPGGSASAPSRVQVNV